MSDVIRKWQTSLNLSLSSDGVAILLPAHLGMLEHLDGEMLDVVNNCHIYLITKRRRIKLAPESLEIADDGLFGRFYQTLNSEKFETNFFIPRDSLPSNYDTFMAHRSSSEEVVITDKDGEVAFAGPFSLILPYARLENRDLLNAEVVYVGQSLGRDKHRNAAQRLLSHSTLQKILAHTLYEDNDSEIILILVEYDDATFVQQWNGAETALISGKEDSRRASRALVTLQNKRMQICVAEAGLINYFKPAYNDKFKHNFPHNKQKFLKELYEIDLDSVVVEINTDTLLLKIYGTTFGPGYHHVAVFNLHDAKKRRSFFSLYTPEHDAIDMLKSGPAY
jgi:hypothetical protein